MQQKIPRPGPEPVYNLEVHGEHVYYVGDNRVLAHNASCGPEGDDDWLYHGTRSNQTITTRGLDMNAAKNFEYFDKSGSSWTKWEDIAADFARNPLRAEHGAPVILRVRKSDLEKLGVQLKTGTGLTEAGEVKILPSDFSKIPPELFQVYKVLE